jgi:hypothetical protein
VIGKLQFAVRSGNIGLLSPQQVSGLTYLFSIRLLFSQLFVQQTSCRFELCSLCLLLEIIFERIRMMMFNRHIKCTFLMLLYQIQPFCENQWRQSHQSFYEYVERVELCLQQGGGPFQYYVVIM